LISLFNWGGGGGGFTKFLPKHRKRLLTVDFLRQRLFLMRRRRFLRGRDRDRWSIEEGF
jgi:hypothetical protein